MLRRARARKLGLWKVCPRTVYDPYRGIEDETMSRPCRYCGLEIDFVKTRSDRWRQKSAA